MLRSVKLRALSLALAVSMGATGCASPVSPRGEERRVEGRTSLEHEDGLEKARGPQGGGAIALVCLGPFIVLFRPSSSTSSSSR